MPALTHIPLDKMASISQSTFQIHFHEWKICITIRVALQFVSKGPTGSKSTLVQVKAHGTKPLSEPTPTQFIYVYMRH